MSEEAGLVPHRLVKRALDLVVAALLLVLLAPVFLFAFTVLALDNLLVARDRGSWF